MPKCVKCSHVLPPQFMAKIEEVEVDVTQCIFCKLEKDTITFPPDENGEAKTYTKTEAINEYKYLLNKLKDKLRTREDLKKFMKGEY